MEQTTIIENSVPEQQTPVKFQVIEKPAQGKNPQESLKGENSNVSHVYKKI